MIALVDTGGSIIDSTSYPCKEARPKVILQGARESECIPACLVFVDRALQSHLESKLRGSRFYDPEDIARMVKRFEESAERRFDGRSTKYYLQFGTKDTTLEFGIS